MNLRLKLQLRKEARKCKRLLTKQTYLLRDHKHRKLQRTRDRMARLSRRVNRHKT